jgi:hypothetical protein
MIVLFGARPALSRLLVREAASGGSTDGGVRVPGECLEDLACFVPVEIRTGECGGEARANRPMRIGRDGLQRGNRWLAAGEARLDGARANDRIFVAE